MKEWLAIYREQVLLCPEMGKWRNRAYPHILSFNDSANGLNLLKEIRSSFSKYAAKEQIRLHRDFAHLNSSQALTFNLFFPLLPTSDSNLVWGRPERLAALLDLDLPLLTHASFEKVVDPKEGTNLDWWGSFSDGSQIFCEVKFTESGYGTASSKSTDYELRLNRIYRPKLEGIIRPGLLDDLNWFRAHYQILRNIAHLSVGPLPDRNLILFVLPAESPAFADLDLFFRDNLETSVSNRVIVWGLESFSENLLAGSGTDEERSHWQDFRIKYCPARPRGDIGGVF